MTRTEQIVAGVLRDLVGYTGPVTDDLSQAAVAGWDSATHIAIVEELESKLNVRFTTEEMVEMLDVRAIKNVLARHGVPE